MQRKSVESSMLREIGYDPETRTLEVEFTSGAVYEYFDVPTEEHEGLLRAESHGQYFLTHIRGFYRYNRLRRTGRREVA